MVRYVPDLHVPASYLDSTKACDGSLQSDRHSLMLCCWETCWVRDALTCCRLPDKALICRLRVSHVSGPDHEDPCWSSALLSVMLPPARHSKSNVHAAVVSPPSSITQKPCKETEGECCNVVALAEHHLMLRLPAKTTGCCEWALRSSGRGILDRPTMRVHELGVWYHSINWDFPVHCQRLKCI